MFYRPGEEDHGLPHNPFKALVAPRPIGWIGSRDAEGRDNLAPYSFFNAVADQPPMVMFSSTGAKPDRAAGKDSVANIRETGVFSVNIVSHALRDAMNASAAPAPAGTDEFALTGLDKAPCETIACARVAAAPACLECRLHEVITLPGPANFLVLGVVVGIHIDEAVMAAGMVDVTRYRPLSRLGYRDYAAVERVFPLDRPGQAPLGKTAGGSLSLPADPV